MRQLTKVRIQRSGIGLITEDIKQILIDTLGEDEYERIRVYKNSATQIVDAQSQDLLQCFKEGRMDSYKHAELQRCLEEFYNLQGMCERIKKFPLPRQYGAMSFVFVMIFIFMLPFGLIPELAKLGPHGAWLAIPAGGLVGWVYFVMELVGDYSENPFEGMGNDIPMMALSRTIEIDLREMLGETDLPPAIEPINGILM